MTARPKIASGTILPNTRILAGSGSRISTSSQSSPLAACLCYGQRIIVGASIRVLDRRMDGQEMKALRRSRGMTQNDVAAALGVEQGTVSRWERGVEAPRPANLAGLHKVLLSLRLDGPAKKRVDAILKNSLYQATLVDNQGRMVAFSSIAVDFFRERYDVDLISLLGRPFQTLIDQINQTEVLWPLEQYGLFKGKYLLSRCYTNWHGLITCNEFETVFDNGAFAGTLLYASSRYRIAKNNERNVVKIEVISLDDPGQVVTVYEGRYSEQIHYPDAAV